jgi:hypothetical protein
MSEDLSLDAFRGAAERAGLKLTTAEADEALAGANRWRHNVKQLRRLLEADLEPAPVFRAPRHEQSV